MKTLITWTHDKPPETIQQQVSEIIEEQYTKDNKGHGTIEKPEFRMNYDFSILQGILHVKQNKTHLFLIQLD